MRKPPGYIIIGRLTQGRKNGKPNEMAVTWSRRMVYKQYETLDFAWFTVVYSK